MCHTLSFVELCDSSFCIRVKFNGCRTWGKIFLGDVEPMEWFRLQCARQHNFSAKIRVTDEARLTGKSVLNFHSAHLRSNENPHNFFEQTLPVLVEDIPLQTRQDMWFLHDDAPPTSPVKSENSLHSTHPGRWIASNGPVRWPARSSVLNALDVYFRGYMYTNDVDTAGDLRRRMVAILSIFVTILCPRTICCQLFCSWSVSFYFFGVDQQSTWLR
jgi:hypothetical protein